MTKPVHRANGPYYPVGDLGGEHCVKCRTPWPCAEITKVGAYPRCSSCLGSLPLKPMPDCKRKVDHYNRDEK